MHAHSLQWVMLLVSLTLVCSFQIRSFSYKSSFSASVPTNNRNPTGTDLSMLPDGFSLPLADLFPADTSTLSTGSFLVQNTQADDIQNAAIITAAISYFIYEKRPRGSANAELFEVKRSSIPGANLGLFCKSVIPKGTVLGTYPGVLGKVTKALERKSSDKAREAAKKYMWLVDDSDTVLDPTNAEGALPPTISFFFGLLRADTLMARINEPPPGRDCNVYVKQQGSDLEIIAERDIVTGEEIFIDYGYSYDRSSYGESSDSDPLSGADAAKRADTERRMREMAKLQKEIDELTLQPIRDTNVNDSDKSKVSQDTTLPGGFIDKLRKQESDEKTKKKQNKSGVITPEEGMTMFNEIGTGMFSSSEDRELIDSMLGKKKKNKSKKNSRDDDDDDDEDDGDDPFGGASAGVASKEEIEMMDSLFGRKPSSGSIIDIAQSETVSASKPSASGSGSSSSSRSGTTRSIFEMNPSKLKTPEQEAQEVEDEIEDLLKSIREKNRGRGRAGGVSDDSGTSSFVDDFAANNYLGAIDFSDDDEEDDEDDYDYGDEPVSKSIIPTPPSSTTTTTSSTTSSKPSAKPASSTPAQSSLPPEPIKNDKVGEINKSSKMLAAEAELQKQLENMSDEEIKIMFRRIRENVARNNKNGGDRSSVIPSPPPRGSAAAELDLFALNKVNKLSSSRPGSTAAGKGFGADSKPSTSSGNEKYPKAKPSDPKVREKYKSELEMFESELESLYQDPLAVWQDMVMNPDILKDLDIPDAGGVDSSNNSSDNSSD